MTQAGKCDTCRQRKVKCDEKRPKCGACRIKDRKCYYTYGKVSQFVHEEPEVGTVRCRSAVRTQNTSLALPTRHSKPVSFSVTISSPQAGHSARWVNMIGPSPDRSPFRNFGDWITLVPTRIGSSSIVDLAVVHLMDSCDMYRTPGNQLNRTKARESGWKSLRSLRSGLLEAQETGSTSDLVLAVNLHYIAEIFAGVGTFNYILHIFGLSSLLKGQKTRRITQDEETDNSILWSFYMEEAAESAIIDRESEFSKIPELCNPSPKTLMKLCPVDRALAMMGEIWSPTPRLSRLVRQWNQDPTSAPTSLCIETINLAQTLYTHRSSSLVDKIIAESTTIVETYDPEIAQVVPRSYRINDGSVPVFLLMKTYYANRLIIYGLLLTICDLMVDDPPFDCEVVQAQDLHAATMIEMCLDWTTMTYPELPASSLRIGFPMQMAYGAWHRLEKRLPPGESQEREDVRFRKKWVLGHVNRIRAQWLCWPTKHEDMQTIVEGFAGGPWSKEWDRRREKAQLWDEGQRGSQVYSSLDTTGGGIEYLGDES